MKIGPGAHIYTWHALRDKVGVISTDDMLGRLTELKKWMEDNNVKMRKI